MEGKMKGIKFLVLGIITVFMVGCQQHAFTEAPKPTNQWFSEQYMVQAAHHWDVMAFSVSNNILYYTDDRFNLPRQIYIAPAANSVFEQNYREYLKSHLTDHGFAICPEDTCGLAVSFHTNTIYHPTFPVKTGYREDQHNRYNRLQKSELVVVNDIHLDGKIIGTITRTKYFKDGEFQNYEVKKVKTVPTKTYNVSGTN